MIELHGMSWDHPRGHDSIVAAAEAFHAVNPEIHFTWETRSLQAFADHPIEELAERFDLILIDHPFTGFAAASGCLLPIDTLVDSAFLDDQAANSVGHSHECYQWDGHQWALATDAASQVSTYRPELLDRLGLAVPASWDEVVAFGEARKGQSAALAIPLIPVDTFMCFLSICASYGEPAFATEERVISRETGRFALELLLRLKPLVHPESFTWNPIRCYDRMSTTDEIGYVPLAFGYSNYSRPGFRPNLIHATDVPRAEDGTPRGAGLGGVGLAISAGTAHPDAAVRFAQYAASGEVQRGVYFTGGGQPGHRSAWTDDGVNAASANFFRNTLATLDHSYLRPRFNGYMSVQDNCFALSYHFLTETEEIDATLDGFDAFYREGLANGD
jgi:multiple sugar transport system substrate-binding protein